MAGRGPLPKAERRRAAPPVRGDYRQAPGVGWQHGEIPTPPDGLTPASIEAWSTWMAGWFAAHWAPGDLPGLRLVIVVHDRVERGEYERASDLRLLLDTYGITPKGQRDRRWSPPPGHPVQRAERLTREHPALFRYLPDVFSTRDGSIDPAEKTDSAPQKRALEPYRIEERSRGAAAGGVRPLSTPPPGQRTERERRKRAGSSSGGRRARRDGVPGGGGA